MVEKKKYYVKQSDENIYSVDLDELNALSSFALTLEPNKEVREVDGYQSALYEYYSKNNNELKKCYDEINGSFLGKEFLSINISVLLAERDIMNNGLNKDNLEIYKKYLELYQNKLDYSQIFIEEDKKERAK